MQILHEAVDWLERHAALSSLVVIGSIVFVIVSLWAVHRFLVTIPPDYFQHDHKRFDRWRDSRPVLRYGVLVGKNLLGGLLVLLGLVMLFTPGQGVLSILLGLVADGHSRQARRGTQADPARQRAASGQSPARRRGQPPLEF